MLPVKPSLIYEVLAIVFLIVGLYLIMGKLWAGIFSLTAGIYYYVVAAWKSYREE